MKYLFSLLFLFAFSSFFSQKIELENINGKYYYVHLVEKGNTLYQIKRKYNVEISDIVKVNPGLESHLIIGQRVLVPADINTIYHKVKPSETLYSLSRHYKVSQDSIINDNPSSKDGIKIGQTLIIRNAVKRHKLESLVSDSKSTINVDSSEVVVSDFNNNADSLIKYVVQPGETIYSLSKRYMCDLNELKKLNNIVSSVIKDGQVLLIPIPTKNGINASYRHIQADSIVISGVDTLILDSTLLFPNKVKYNVAIFLPLYLQKGSKKTKGEKREAYSSIDYLMGAKLALKALSKKRRVAFDVYAYDYKSDSASINDILNRQEFDSIDLVFSPFDAGEALLVANWCLLNNIQMVTPIPKATRWVSNNPMVYHSIPSNESMLKTFANKMLSEKYLNRQVVLINSGNPNDDDLFDAFRGVFYSDSNKMNKKLITSSMNDFTDYLSKDSSSILVLASDNDVVITEFLSKIDLDSKVTLFGNKQWLKNKEYGKELMKSSRFMYADFNNFYINKPSIKLVHKKYRATWQSHINKMVVHGYDVVHFFSSYLLLKEPYKKGLMTNFDIQPNLINGGFENVSCFITSNEIKKALKKKREAEEKLQVEQSLQNKSNE